MSDSKMICVTGLWKNKTKEGKTYLGGPWCRVRVLVFINEKKQKDTDPDYYMCFAPIEPKQENKPETKGDAFESS